MDKIELEKRVRELSNKVDDLEARIEMMMKTILTHVKPAVK